MDIKKTIDDLGFDKVTVTNVAYNDGYATVNINGGENGHGNWIDYLNQISEIVKAIKGWVVSIENDCPDDIWYAELGTHEI